MNNDFYIAVYETLIACGWENWIADMFVDYHFNMGNDAINLFMD